MTAWTPLPSVSPRTSSSHGPSERTASSAPIERAACSFASLETTAIERAPSAAAISSAAVPTPPAAPWTSTVSPA
jgi:hypothetical protein